MAAKECKNALLTILRLFVVNIFGKLYVLDFSNSDGMVFEERTEIEVKLRERLEHTLKFYLQPYTALIIWIALSFRLRCINTRVLNE